MASPVNTKKRARAESTTKDAEKQTEAKKARIEAPETPAPAATGIQGDILALIKAEFEKQEKKVETMLDSHRQEMQKKEEEIEKTSKKVMKALKMALEFSATQTAETDAPAKNSGKKINKGAKNESEDDSDDGEEKEDNEDNGENEDMDDSEGMDADEEDGAAPKKPKTDAEILEQRNPQGKTRLFIKDLHTAIDEEKLRATFVKCGKIKKLWFVKDRESNKFYGTAFVEFDTPLAAAKALGLKGVKVMGRPLRIRIAKEEKNKAGRGTVALPSEIEKQRPVSVFIGNLPDDVDQKVFKKDFKAFGEIISLRFVKDKVTGEFKRCAFVGYKSKAAAEAALKMNGQIWMGKALNIELAKS